MTEYFDEGTHFWEYQTIDTDDGAITWERYDPSVQKYIYNELEENNKLAALKIEDTDIEIIFDHENGNHRQRGVNNGSERVVRRTPEVIVKDWNVFKQMTDVSKITKLNMGVAYGDEPKINDHDAQELASKLANCTSLWYLTLSGNNLTDAFGVVFLKALATYFTTIFFPTRRELRLELCCRPTHRCIPLNWLAPI
eukprot:m.238672 g.238672  ORF g.238672 m.238672 type:complete len:196 (-) comp33726_c1_seq14:3889-4476(-)